VFEAAKITYIYWSITCTLKPSFEWLFKFARITYIYWSIDCITRV
jgi:hypothetical protein